MAGLSRLVGALDEAGDAVRKAIGLTGPELDMFMRTPAFRALSPADQLKVMRGDPTPILRLNADKQPLESLGQRFSTEVEMPYRIVDDGTNPNLAERPLDASAEPETGLVPYGFRGRGVPVGGPGEPIRGELIRASQPRPQNELIVRQNPNWTEDPFGADSPGSALMPFGTRGRGVPVGGAASRGGGLIVAQPQSPRGRAAMAAALAAAGTAGAYGLYELLDDDDSLDDTSGTAELADEQRPAPRMMSPADAEEAWIRQHMLKGVR